MTLNSSFVTGAGASEIEIAYRLRQMGGKIKTQDQYAIKKFGEALEVVPRILAENAGLDGTDVITQLYAAHAEGKSNVGVNVEVRFFEGVLRFSVPYGSNRMSLPHYTGGQS